MAHSSRYKLAFKRRKEGKTDYKARLKLIGQNKHRVIVRLSNKHIIAQVVTTKTEGDQTLVAVNSKELERLGWKAGGKNISAAYLTGFLAGKKALKDGIEEATMDIGLKTSLKGSKLYAVLKGAVDSGLDIPHNESVLPADERINGEHIAKYAQDLNDKETKEIFSKYREKGIEPSQLPEHFTTIKEKIEEELS